MRIYSMTATFGKLEHETLTLTPGLNIIEAPNEWGKSTWCAFLVAMLYGIETRVHSTKTALADKERYAPWSGSPMSGSIDLSWNGRDITIQRRTKGRSIFGDFRAFETATGVEVPELTAANCGQVLLGVEKTVFTRAGFLKLTDLPVTEDKALWRRLNALVTTGDESGTSDTLAQTLRDLKNRCRANRSNGLIPQALAQKAELEEKLRQLQALQDQSRRLHARKEDLTRYGQKLADHRAALQHQAAKEQAQRFAEAQLRLREVTRNVQQLQDICSSLPPAEEIYRRLTQLQQLRQQRESLQMEAQMLPQAPVIPETPAPFRGCTPEQAAAQAQEDLRLYQQCRDARKKPSTWLFILGFCITGTGFVSLSLFDNLLPAIILLAVGILATIAGLLLWNNRRQQATRQELQMQSLLERYRPLPPESWEAAALSYAQKQEEYTSAAARHQQGLSHIHTAMEDVNRQIDQLTGGLSYLQCEEKWRSALAQHNAYSDALRQQRQTEDMVQALSGQEQALPPAPESDDLTFSSAETARLLSDTDYELRQLQHQIGHCYGQMESLGQESALRQQLEAVNTRLTKLEDTYAALEIAQQTLAEASAEMQRRFAPRISQQAQDIFGRLTGQRYDRLALGSDLTLSVSAQNEDTLRGSLWRSDGTIDQLYLSLRLAVARELTPQAPLILDDALVRFDNIRLAAAMEILKEEAQNKQVILFTCQSREKEAL